MSVEQEEAGGVIKPGPALSKKYFLPILFLGERMAEVDGFVAPVERRVVEQLAQASKTGGFRKDKDYRFMNDTKACDMLDNDKAKLAALVVISLVLKADMKRTEEESEYYAKIKELLEMGPVTVPTEIKDHKELALAYFQV